MAVFVIRALLKSDTFPYSAVQAFDDVEGRFGAFEKRVKKEHLAEKGGEEAKGSVGHVDEIAGKFAEARDLQTMWLMPANGRGRPGGSGVTSVPPA